MDLHVAEGTLLCASPDMLDPNFMHGVVLICSHSPEGAYGLTVNRPSGHSTEEVLADHPILGNLDVPVYLGGPVGLNQMQVLHGEPDKLPGGAPLLEGVFLGADLDDVAQLLQACDDPAETRVRLIVGYSGWGESQLDGELESGSWLPAPGTSEYVFGGNGQELWRRVVRSIGNAARGLDDQPPDPSWN